MSFSAAFLAGAVNGRAPLFERFTLGDSRTLRGWSKFDIAPLGGTRVAHGSLEYTFHWVGRVLRYRLSLGTRGESECKAFRRARAWADGKGSIVAVAFPLRSGSVQPLFILGMNF